MTKELKYRSKKEAFIKMMGESDELANYGFDLLIKKRADFYDYFDDLERAGFFGVDKNRSTNQVNNIESTYHTKVGEQNEAKVQKILGLIDLILVVRFSFFRNKNHCN